MNALFTLKLTAKGKQPGDLEYLLASTGFDTINVLAVRTWRTRVLTEKARQAQNGKLTDGGPVSTDFN